MSSLSSRLAALALTALVALALIGGAALVNQRFVSARAEIALLEDQLARFQAAARAERGPGAAVVADQALFQQQSLAMTALEIQDVAAAAVAAAGGALTSLRVEPTSPFEGAIKTPLTLELSIDMAGLAALLHALETQDPYIFVEGISARRMRGRDADRAERGPEAPAMAAVQLRLYGLSRRLEEL